MFNIFDSEHKPLQNKAEMKRWARWLFAGILAAVIILIDILTGWIQFPPAESYGNTSGNIANMGLAVEKEGWIYYCSSIIDGCLYKVKPDGSEKTKLTEEPCMFINVAEGWVYYGDKKSGNLCKIKTDGTGFEILDSAGIIYVENGWIYIKDNYICKMHTNGTEKTQLSANKAGLMNIADGWIYYTNLDDECSLYKIRVDGTDNTNLNIKEPIFINIAGDWLYYAKYSGNWWYLYKMRTDGTCETLMSDSPVCGTVNVSNDWIYYGDVFDNGSLHKMRTNGTEDVKISGSTAMEVNVAGDWIYYYNLSEGSDFYRIKTDGTENQPVE